MRISGCSSDVCSSDLSNRHYTCTYPPRRIEHGTITLKGSCVSKKGRKVAIAGSGTYTPTSFELTADVATEFAGLNISGRRSEERRVGTGCGRTWRSRWAQDD